ncbi:MAG: DUF1127 domain-containing protein [Hyphomicrobiales bacterium]
MTAIQARGASIPRGRTTGGESSWFRLVLQRIGRLAELYASRRALLLLSRADDRLLKDIGISRADVDWARAQPWHVDGTVALARRIERRKAARDSGRRLAGR